MYRLPLMGLPALSCRILCGLMRAANDVLLSEAAKVNSLFEHAGQDHALVILL